MKSEPDVFGFDDLLVSPERTTCWSGVRNYQARNFMRDEISKGDRVLFYHSNCNPPGVVGIAEIAREAYPDPSQFDPERDEFDPKTSEDDPRWVAVDVRAVKPLERKVNLKEIKAAPELADMKLVQRGNRLSVMPITKTEYEKIIRLARQA